MSYSFVVSDKKQSPILSPSVSSSLNLFQTSTQANTGFMTLTQERTLEPAMESRIGVLNEELYFRCPRGDCLENSWNFLGYHSSIGL